VASSFGFQPNAQLEPAAYQAKWQGLPEAGRLGLQATRVHTLAEIEEAARSGYIYTVASGEVNNVIKCYFFARDGTGAFHMFESNFDKTNGQLAATVKSENANWSAAANAFAAALSRLPATRVA
jgi:hypothetical protein